MLGYLGKFPNDWVFGKFLKYPVIWEIPKISRHLRNIWGICQMPRFLRYSLNIHSFETFTNFTNIPPSNLPNAWVSRKFPKCLGIWETSQMPGYLKNFPNAWVSGKFSKCLGIWQISQILGYLGNLPNAWVSGKSPKCLGIWEISQMPEYLLFVFYGRSFYFQTP